MNTRGFGLVEVIVVAGLLGGLSLVFMNLNHSTQKATVKYQFDSEVNLILNEMIGKLSSPDKCKALLAGKNAITANNVTPHIDGRYYIFSDAQAPAQGYGNGQVRVNNYDLVSTTDDVSKNLAYLNVYFQNKNILKTANTLTTKKINLYVEVDGANNITNCRSLSSASADIWTRGESSNIFYSAGSVGIGTNAPVANLDVAGDVKIGNTLADCTAANEGAMKYDNTEKAILFCNGTKWGKISSAFSKLKIISASENWIVPPGITSIMVEAIGGGGGGSGNHQEKYAGAGGAAGAYCRVFVDVTEGQNLAITIGAGGRGGSGHFGTDGIERGSSTTVAGIVESFGGYQGSGAAYMNFARGGGNHLSGGVINSGTGRCFKGAKGSSGGPSVTVFPVSGSALYISHSVGGIGGQSFMGFGSGGDGAFNSYSNTRYAGADGENGAVIITY